MFKSMGELFNTEINLDDLVVDKILIGKRIEKLRRENYLTQEALALSVGVNTGVIKAYEKGRYMPALGTLVKLAFWLGTSVDYILTGTDLADLDLESLIKHTSDEVKIQILLQLYLYFAQNDQSKAGEKFRQLSFEALNKKNKKTCNDRDGDNI